MQRRLTLILGMTQLVVWGLTYYVPSVMTGPVAAGLGVGAAWVLGGFSLALLATGLASPLACKTIDRVGGRTVMAGGTVVQAAGLLLMAASPGLWCWYLGWAVTGLGMACGLYDAAFATAGRALGAAARPTITGITMIGGFASTLGWPLGAWLVPWLGWRETLAVYAAILLCFNLPLLLLLPRGVPAPVVTPRVPDGVIQGGRSVFACIATFFTLRAGIGTVISISAPILLVGMGLSQVAAIGLVSLIGPAQVAMRVVQAAMGRRWSPAVVAWIGALLFPAVGFPLVFAGPGWVDLAALMFVLGYGASNGILTIARGTLPLHLFGPVGYAARIGRLALPVMLAQAAAPLVSGPLIESWPAWAVFLALTVASVVASAGLAPLLWRNTISAAR